MLKRDVNTLKIVTCHLGNGCSLAAIDGGKSVDTTMGFTPLEGLAMGTRSGSIDPGILTHLVRSGAARAEDLDAILNRQSGLLGVSGVSSDMREVVDAMHSGNERAKLAFDIFVHRLCACIGATAASLGGLHALVFTAGIGENSVEVRHAACERLAFLGLALDQAKNTSCTPDADIARSDSNIPILVIRAQEDWSIARECARVFSAQSIRRFGNPMLLPRTGMIRELPLCLGICHAIIPAILTRVRLKRKTGGSRQALQTPEVLPFLFYGIVGLLLVGTIRSGLFQVRTAEAVVVQRMGKFLRVGNAGINFKLPWLDQIAGRIPTSGCSTCSRCRDQNQRQCLCGESQSRCSITSSPTRCMRPFKLANPKQQISSYVFNVILGHVPKMILDDAFLQQSDIAVAIKQGA